MPYHEGLVESKRGQVSQSRRKHPRIDTDIEVRVRRVDGGGLPAGRIRNISLGGVFVESEPLAFGTELQLSFKLPINAKTLDCSGYVVWSTKGVDESQKPQGMDGNGVRLTRIGVLEMKQLAQFVHGEIEEP